MHLVSCAHFLCDYLMFKSRFFVVLTYYYFIQTCLPLLLEKLSSDVLTAKLDSLYALVAAAPVYGPVALEPFLEQLWIAIEKEVCVCVCVCCVLCVSWVAFVCTDVQVGKCGCSSEYNMLFT